MGKTNISQHYLLDKLVSEQGLKCKKKFLSSSFQLIDHKVTFDFRGF